MRKLSNQQITELERLKFKRDYTPTSWSRNIGRLTITVNPTGREFNVFLDENNSNGEVINSIYVNRMTLLRLSIFTEMLIGLEAFEKPKIENRKSKLSLPKGFFD
jgi:hypothetical protein